ncbi:hypothetical protein TD95_004289 [Thielaviopsis punctulata]|uniref:Uncharacterized protein n=1 Tax=Thielaviopsis punctulata TaxID=72032 RepID=A0A0F4ZFA8_9PEZI|nr:hypothetical protein TD95_004289 [Thielaviopsis punctulata]
MTSSFTPRGAKEDDDRRVVYSEHDDLLELPVAIPDVDALVSDESWDVNHSANSTGTGTPKPPPGLGLSAPPGLSSPGNAPPGFGRPNTGPPGFPNQAQTSVEGTPQRTLAQAAIVKAAVEPLANSRRSSVTPPTAALAPPTTVSTPIASPKGKNVALPVAPSTPERPNTLAKIAAAAAVKTLEKDKDGNISSSSTEPALPQTPRTPMSKVSVLKPQAPPVLHDEDFPALDSHKPTVSRSSVPPNLSRVASTNSPKRVVTETPKTKRAGTITITTPVPTKTLSVKKPEATTEASSPFPSKSQSSVTASPSPRKGVTKEVAALTEAALVIEPEIAHAPVLGRKKKQKKDKPASAKKSAASAASPQVVAGDDETEEASKTATADETSLSAAVSSSQGLDARLGGDSDPISVNGPVADRDVVKGTENTGAPAKVKETGDKKKGKDSKTNKGKSNNDVPDKASVSAPAPAAAPAPTPTPAQATASAPLERPTKGKAIAGGSEKPEQAETRKAAAKKMEPLVITADQAAGEPAAQNETRRPLQKDEAKDDTSESTSTLSELFSRLQAQNILPSLDKLSFFSAPVNDGLTKQVKKALGDAWRNAPSDVKTSDRAQHDMEIGKGLLDFHLSDEEVDALQEGKPVRRFHNGLRLLVTPNGDVLRNLLAEEEEQYLEYQSRLAADVKNPRTFISENYQSSTPGFTLVRNRVQYLGPPTFFPQNEDGKVRDISGKIMQEKGLSHLNESIMPRLYYSLPNISVAQKKSLQDMRVDATIYEVAPIISGHLPSTPGMDGMEHNYNSGFITSPIEGNGTVSGGGYRSGYEQRIGSTGTLDRSATDLRDPPMLSVPDAEMAYERAKQDSDYLESRLNRIMKSNRRLLLGTGH